MLDIFFSDFRWYRKYKGGSWYKILDTDESGWTAGIVSWQREKPDPGSEVLETEIY